MAKRFTPTRIHNVTVPSPNSYMRYSLRRDGFEPPKLAELSGYYQTQDWGRTWVKIVSSEVNVDGYTIEEAIVELREQAEGINNPTLDIETDAGDDYPRIYVKGSRPAKDAEVAEVLRYLEWDKARRDENDKAARERLIEQAKALGITADDLS